MNNNLPPHWKSAKLGEVCEIFSGYGFSKELQGNSVGKYPFYKVGDISKNVQSGYKYLTFCENYIDDPVLQKLKAKLFPSGTIVFAKIGEALKLNRRAIIKNEGIVDNNAIGLKALNNICDDLFLYYFLTKLRLEDYCRATTVPSVRKSDIEYIPFIFPPLPEQNLIVSKIEELFSELDKSVENLKTAQQQLKTYRQSVLKWAFEGKLTNSEFRIQNSELAMAAEPSGIYGNNNLPDGWKWVKLDELLNFIGSGATPKGGREIYKEKGITFIRSQNVYPNELRLDDVVYITKEIDEKLQRSRVLPNDVLLNITGASIGRCTFVPKIFDKANVNQHVCILRFPQDTLLSKYLSLFLNSPKAQDHILKNQIGATRQALNYSQIREFEIPMPKINIQHEIVQEIETRFAEADKMENTISQSLQQCEAMRQSILKKAFEGNLISL